MRIIALKTLRLFWEQHPEAQQALQAWYRDAKRATWKTPADIKNVYRNASIVGNNRVVFNIRGNQYRFDAAPTTPDGDRLDVLATLVEAYEEQHYSRWEHSYNSTAWRQAHRCSARQGPCKAVAICSAPC